MKYPWQQDRTWNDTKTTETFGIAITTKQKQYKHAQLSYYRNRVNYTVIRLCLEQLSSIRKYNVVIIYSFACRFTWQSGHHVLEILINEHQNIKPVQVTQQMLILSVDNQM